MWNKRSILLCLFLVICLFGGGLYYAASHPAFPCPIVPGSDSLISRSRLLVYHHYVAAELTKTAKKYNQNPSQWKRVVVCYINGKWICFAYQTTSTEVEEKAWFVLCDNDESHILQPGELSAEVSKASR